MLNLKGLFHPAFLARATAKFACIVKKGQPRDEDMQGILDETGPLKLFYGYYEYQVTMPVQKCANPVPI